MMKSSLKRNLLICSGLLACTLATLALFHSISIATAAMVLALMVVPVAIGIVISEGGQSPVPVASLLYDVEPRAGRRF